MSGAANEDDQDEQHTPTDGALVRSRKTSSLLKAIQNACGPRNVAIGVTETSTHVQATEEQPRDRRCPAELLVPN